ncbi:uncharacterized protein LOC124159809 [Ischnura elegans]|uniref:uncharacterized protein LOC124159809 n=1 Tax=Ischnura elegans TaxID=197161 RepID=UPI001ED87866|nr:uncharacterized protein LOC124159809 [Ischnura elegans]
MLGLGISCIPSTFLILIHFFFFVEVVTFNYFNPSGSAPKRRKYLYFEQLLFLRDSLECRNTSSSLEHNNIDLNESAGEDNDVEPSPKADCPPKPGLTRNSRKHSTSRSFEESLLQILQDKRDEEKDIDVDKYFLLSLLPAFRRFNDDQKFYARTEIMNIMRRVRQSGSQNQMQTPYVLEQTNSQASTSQYFSTFVPRGQFQELLPPAAITSQNVWENTSTSPQF